MDNRTFSQGFWALVGSAFCFGWIGTLMRQIHATPTTTVVIYRLLIGAAALWLLAQRPRWPSSRHEQRLLMASGLLYGVTALLYIGSYRYTTIAKAGFLHYLAPVFVILLAPLLLRECPRPALFLALSVALIGVVLLLRIDWRAGVSLATWRGDGLAAASAVTYALYTLLGRQLQSEQALVTAFWVHVFALIPPLGMALLRGPEALRVTAGDWPGIIGLGVVSSALSFALFYRGLRFIPAAQATLIMLLSPVTNALLGYLLSGETLTPGQLLGAGLILTAAVLARS